MASKALLQSALLSIASFSLVSARAIPPPTGNGPVLNVNFPDPTILYTQQHVVCFRYQQPIRTHQCPDSVITRFHYLDIPRRSRRYATSATMGCWAVDNSGLGSRRKRDGKHSISAMIDCRT